MKQGKVVIFSAPSGAGKTTVVGHLLKVVPKLEFSISATTRARRPHERDGVDYHFLTGENFREKVSNDEFLEFEEVYPGLLYGTLKTEVANMLRAGRNVIFDVDVRGGLNIKKYFGEQALSVFLSPPDLNTLRVRLAGRHTESGPELEMRLQKAAEEMTFASKFDKVLINNVLNLTFTEAEKLVKDFLGIS